MIMTKKVSSLLLTSTERVISITLKPAMNTARSR